MPTIYSIPNTVEIPLTKGFIAIVDEADADLCQLNWYAVITPKTPYARRRAGKHEPGNVQYLHVAVMSRVLNRPIEKGEEVDHTDRDGLNCRRSNLRLATKTQNQHNQGLAIRNTSGYKGVSWHKKAGKWQAVISVSTKKVHLGYFDSPEAAHAAYADAAKRYFGEFGRAE